VATKPTTTGSDQYTTFRVPSQVHRATAVAFALALSGLQVSLPLGARETTPKWGDAGRVASPCTINDRGLPLLRRVLHPLLTPTYNWFLATFDTGGELIQAATFRPLRQSNVERPIGGLSLVVSH